MANINIGGRLHSSATGNVVSGANEILDDTKGKKQDVINAEVDEALAGKQATIDDLSTIRSGAAAGATAYQKPGTGIPKSDTASDVQTSLGKADTAYQKPSGGIPKSDTASGVQQSLDLADSAVQADPIGTIVPPVDPSEFATKEEVEGLEAEAYELVDLAKSHAWQYILISGTGKFGTNGSYTHELIPCTPGDKFYIRAGVNAVRYAWFTQYIKPTSGATAPLVPGTDRYEIVAGNVSEVTAPSSAAFLYIQLGDYTPASIEKVMSFSTRLSKIYDDSTNITDFDLSNPTTLRGYIDGNGVWKGTGNNRHILLDAVPGSVLRIYGAYQGVYAFLTSDEEAVANASAPLVTGTTTHTIPDGETVDITIPEGTMYLYLYAGNVLDGGGGTYSIPCSVEQLNTISTKQDCLVPGKSIKTINNESILGEGNLVLATSGDIEDLKKAQGELFVPIDISSLAEIDYAYITGQSKWATLPGRYGSFIPVSEGEHYRIVAGENFARYSFLTEIPATITEGGTPPFVSGTSVNQIDANKTGDVLIPSGCVALQINRTYDEVDYSPSAVYNMDESQVVKINEELRSHNVSTIIHYKPIGNGNTFVSEYLVASEGSYRIYVDKNVDMAGVTSTGVYRFRVYFYDSNNEIISYGPTIAVGTPLQPVYDLAAPAGTVRMRVGFRCTAGVVFNFAIEKLCGETGGHGTILECNPGSEFVPKFLSAKKRFFTSSQNDKPNPLVLMHISDIHGNWTNVQRFLTFADCYSEYIDILLNTGDTVYNEYTDGIAGYSALYGIEKIFNVIGNHDTRVGNDWVAKKGVEAYNMFISPFVASWGVTQPTNAAENGYCYYYKDFTEKSIRLVVVDIMSYDLTENEWLESVLQDAVTNDLSVVIATHFAGARTPAESSQPAFNKVMCNYTTLYPLGGNSSELTGYNNLAYLMMDTVDSFMNDGGRFIGYIQGHYHADFVAKCEKYPSQLIYSIGSSKAGEMRDFDHIVGTRNQDEFQIISIDPVNTIVKLYKVGANYDRFGRKKGSVCVDYSTGQVLGEGW